MRETGLINLNKQSKFNLENLFVTFFQDDLKVDS